MSNNDSLNLNLCRTMNRAITFTTFPSGKPLHFTVLHHKKTSAIQFEVDNKNNLIKSGKIIVSMYRNLNNCNFCKIFIKTEELKNKNSDYQCKFGGLNSTYKKDIIQFFHEKLDLHVNSRKDNQNYLEVMGFKLIDFGDDIVFYFVQRKTYNNITRTNIIRTAGLQFVTRRGQDTLEAYYDDFENSMKKVNNLPDDFLDMGEEIDN